VADITVYRKKPQPPRPEVASAARYVPGQSLDSLRRVAMMTGTGRVAVAVFEDGPVLVARWLAYPDDHPATVEWTVVRRGNHLLYSDEYDSLHEYTDAELARWYEEVPGAVDAG
jgi:hypothetical protein